jgi:lysophospholipase L1-like esterase
MSVSITGGVSASRGLGSVTSLRAALDKSATWGSAVVTNKTHFPYNGFSSGSSQTVNYRSAHWTKRGSRVSALKLVFVNSSLTATGEAAGNAAHTVKASIEYNGATYPVYFGFGNRTKTLAVDEQVTSDPVYVSIPENTQFYVRTYVTVAVLGEKWPVAASAITGIGEGFSATTDKSDDVAYTTFSAASLYQPAAILGMCAEEAYNVVIIGSSSAQGQGDTAEASHYDVGYLSRALSNQHGVLKLTRGSTTMNMFLTTPGYTRQLEFLNRVRPTHIIQQLGSNDLTSSASVATMKSRMADMWDILGSTGARILQCTYTPVTTSTDNWATLENQTVVASNDERIEVNEWLRSGAGGSTAITGIVECCAVESSLNSGKFKVTGSAGGYTADGTHLTQLAHQETAASINMAALLAR